MLLGPMLLGSTHFVPPRYSAKGMSRSLDGLVKARRVALCSDLSKLDSLFFS